MTSLKSGLKRLRKSLPKGTVSLIAKRRRLSAEYVRRVLRGDAIRLDIIQDAIEAVQKDKAAREKIKQKITQL